MRRAKGTCLVYLLRAWRMAASGDMVVGKIFINQLYVIGDRLGIHHV